MPIGLSSRSTIMAAVLVGLLTGLAIPLRALGVALEQGALGAAFIGALFIAYLVPAVRQRLLGALTSPLGLAVAGMFACWAVGVVFSYNPVGSLRIGGRTAALLLASAVLWAALKENATAQEVTLKALVSASLVTALVALISLNGMPLFVDTPEITYKAFAAAAMCLVPAVVWAGRKLDGKWRWAAYLFVPVSLGIILQTYNRAALAGALAMAVTAVLVLIVNRHRHAKLLLMAVVVSAASALGFIISRELATPSVEGLYLPQWLVDPHRQYIWQFAFKSFLNNPWFGTGIDQLNYIPSSHEFAPGFDGHTALLPSHPHNGVLEILAETGLLGFVPFIFVLGSGVGGLLRRCLNLQDEGNMALLALMVGFWTSALFNFSIWSTWWLLTLFTLIAIIAMASSADHGARDGSRPTM